MANPYNFFINPFAELSPVTVEYTSGSGTWTCPAGVTSIYVECWGSSSGSFGSYKSEEEPITQSGDGSGGAAYAAGTVSVTPGNSYAYVVAAGGAAGIGKPYATPGAGASSTFNSTSIVAVGSSFTTGGNAASCTGDVRYSGGNASAGDSNHSGAGGSSAGPLGAGVNASGATGGNSSDPDAGDGANGITIQGNGVQGTAPGGGSCGSISTGSNQSHNGAAGRPGKVRITYYA